MKLLEAGRNIYWIISCWVFCLFLAMPLYADDTREDSPILIISSYNPEAFQTSNNISEFLDEYKQLGGTSSVIIENMNCKGFSESPRWKAVMRDILNKYKGKKVPQAVVLLGQEAWAAYLSQQDIKERDIPVICGMVSQNAVILPADTVNLVDWEPESLDFEEEYGDRLCISGFAYKYDVVENIHLIRKFYPSVQHIAFISDNSYGGVTMQALVRKEMRNFPDLDLILLDGRKHSIYTIVDRIATLPAHTAILIGTWRVDKNDGYFMKNATYSMMSANPHLPAFSLASVGLGHWVIGGYSPAYRNIGKDLARQVLNIQNNKGNVKGLTIIPNRYTFDDKKLKEFHIDEKLIPGNVNFVNKDQTFFEKYRIEILFVGAAFLLLLFGFLTTLYWYVRTKKLKDELLVSEGELVAAKERAEESDRLKSAFLANMSHEIRTPLNAIVGFSNVLVTGDCSEDEQKEFVSVIQTNSDLLLRLIGDILDISRLETGKLKFTYEECDLVVLCQQVMATTSCSKKPGVEYKFSSPFDTYSVETDVQRLQQVLINLLSNANKFTTEGHIALEFHEDEKHEFLVFSVSDTGCGIPEDKQEKVFERFEKLNEYAQGTGLGLAICRITIGIFGGKIWVDKDYKEGARFVFTHPVKRPGKAEM